MWEHIENELLITDKQHGFRRGLNTTTQLLHVVHNAGKAINESKNLNMISFDFAKAFDKVWHAGLVFKLKSFGITGPLLDWLMDYLKDRLQRISIDGIYSIWELIKTGVPQGSVLGHLLFIIYINDIVENIKSGIKLFANNTSLYITIDDNLTKQQIS